MVLPHSPAERFADEWTGTTTSEAVVCRRPPRGAPTPRRGSAHRSIPPCCFRRSGCPRGLVRVGVRAGANGDDGRDGFVSLGYHDLLGAGASSPHHVAQWLRSRLDPHVFVHGFTVAAPADSSNSGRGRVDWPVDDPAPPPRGSGCGHHQVHARPPRTGGRRCPRRPHRRRDVRRPIPLDRSLHRRIDHSRRRLQASDVRVITARGGGWRLPAPKPPVPPDPALHSRWCWLTRLRNPAPTSGPAPRRVKRVLRGAAGRDPHGR